MNDILKQMQSLVTFKPTTNIRFVAEELRRYGIKTNNHNEKNKTIFYQSAHIIQTFDIPNDKENNGIVYPSYSLVSFKDLFKIIGKNDSGVDDQDIVRVWVIAEKLEKRRIIQITGTSKQDLDVEDKPVLPNVYANLHHIHRNDKEKENYSYKSKFATNKQYQTTDGRNLLGVSDYFVLI